MEASALILLLANSGLAGLYKSQTSLDPRDLSVAVFAPAVSGLIVVGLASLFRIGRSRPARARVLLATMFLLLLGQCGHRALVGASGGSAVGRVFCRDQPSRADS